MWDDSTNRRLHEYRDMTDFDTDTFLDWLDDRDGSVRADTLHEEWPDFPFDEMGVGFTVGIDDDGTKLYYKHDLRRAAKGLPNLD
jgi:hypothetical protein